MLRSLRFQPFTRGFNRAPVCGSRTLPTCSPHYRPHQLCRLRLRPHRSTHRRRHRCSAVTRALFAHACAVTDERPAVALYIDCCTARRCAAGTCVRLTVAVREHVRRFSVRDGNGCARTAVATVAGAPCVRNARARLHGAQRFVTSVAGKTTRNAPEGCGPVLSLKRRDGSNPLRRRLFQPMMVCRRKRLSGLHSKFFSSHPTHIDCYWSLAVESQLEAHRLSALKQVVLRFR